MSWVDTDTSAARPPRRDACNLYALQGCDGGGGGGAEAGRGEKRQRSARSRQKDTCLADSQLTSWFHLHMNYSARNSLAITCLKTSPEIIKIGLSTSLPDLPQGT